MLNQLLAWSAYLALISGVVYTGWNEPLHYRFMSSEDLASARGVQLQTARGKAPPNMQALPGAEASNWRPAGTALDRAPYEKKGGNIIYSENYDHFNTGTQSEASQVKNRTHSGPAAP